jgi:hypothetical protein
MSFLFGGGRPQPTSEQKLAAAEAEVEMVSDMFNRYVGSCDSCASAHTVTSKALAFIIDSNSY